jgi:glutamate racemase
MKIGMVDWGIGGLSVYRELLKTHAGVKCIYFSDSGSKPYGKNSKKELIARLQLITNFFRTKNVTDIIIACNAASTVLDEIQTANPDLNYYGMLSSGVELIKKSKAQKCLVLGGKRTINSGFFQNYFKTSPVQIQAKAAQTLSAFIESGDMNSKEFNKSLKNILSRLKLKPDAILLACTHYPAIKEQIQKIMPQVQILDPGQMVIRHLPKKIKLSSKKTGTLFFTTGSSAAMKKSAYKAFAVKISKAEKVKV